MALFAGDRPKVMAVLGPTNTGKTHFAVERMLAHGSGMIGCPLRLLAREIYDRIAAVRGAGAVALITGEERIQPPGARYWVATVEAMPLEQDVAFLAVDEIQLAADRERGHVFTDRLLHARGREETIFLGADTIRPLLRRLVPEAEVISRPRFSTLRYAAPVKVTRLPRRSALVAFTTQDVYTLAEVVRRHRGGAAVVLGALSPRTRNAQVGLYQAGEVDYLIATDAIGMGLNMDVAHVALASLVKFDGRERRRLHASEIAQIGGRAGRHMQDGSFGTTQEVGGLDPKTIEQVEGHVFPPLKQLRYRNSALDFSSLEALLAALDAEPPTPFLIKTRGAIDDLSLKLLARRDAVRERTTGPAGVRLLWSVCQIPDFRKTLTDAHLHLLERVFRHLADRGRLPTDWVADQVARLERTDGDIDSLIARLAHVRTWTYVAHRADWLDDSAHWQERARAVEDRLSDALHDRLTQRFVDRRTQALLRSLQAGGPLAEIEDDGSIMVESDRVGRVVGLELHLEGAGVDLERRTLVMAARRAAGPELKRRLRGLIAAADEAFELDDRGRVLWRTGQREAAVVAVLRAGAMPLAPRLELRVADSLGGQARDLVRRRLARWLDARIARLAGPLRRLGAAELDGPGRGLAFLVTEGLGNVRAGEARSMVRALGPHDRARLGGLGVRFGVRHLYLPAMLKAPAVTLRACLFGVWLDHPVPPPPPGRVTFRGGAYGASVAEGTGFEVLGGFHVRIDMVERVAARLRALARGGPFTLDAELMALLGLAERDLRLVVEALGYESDSEGRFTVRTRRRSRPAGRRRPARPDSPFAVLDKLRRSG
ncbi:MAG TPA: helicase-related protein [Geminicoccaceae bacterium]